MMKVRKLQEGDRAGEFLLSEVHKNYSRENAEVDGGEAGLPVNSYVEFRKDEELLGGVAFEAVDPNQVVKVAVVVRGAEISLAKVNFPAIADVEADPDAVPPVVAVDGEDATAAARADAIARLVSQGIVVRD